MSADLSGRVVLVTGGARGIGATIAVEVARAGALVAVGYRASRDAAEGVVTEIRGAGGTAEAFPGDLSESGQVREVVAQVERRLGAIDGLVNCAAVMSTREFLATDEAEWERVIRNDLYSVVFTCQAVLPGMIERGRGAIVNITSRLADAGAVDAAPYAAAKAAVVALTRSLAVGYAPRGVRINAVSPGTTLTDMGRHVIESPVGRDRMTRIPIRRFVETSEVAAAVVFLLSDAAAAFAGQTLHVNGGELMR
jgi:NAD(P)-dependent dehydrogenase (short-subunit alcohol dehydrogenase family)